jgi:transcription antitermination factor NusG
VTENGGALSTHLTATAFGSILDGPELQVEACNWLAVQTKPRHEKKVNLELSEKGVQSFLPLQKERRQWSDRQHWTEVPLFSHYVFVRVPLTSESRIRVLQTAGVLQFAGAAGRGTPIPDEQIENLQAIVNERIPLMCHSYVNVGEKVRICGGALNGVEGVLVAIKNDRKLVVSVDLIQRSVAIQLDGFEVERI